jgi:hypothetical protein
MDAAYLPLDSRCGPRCVAGLDSLDRTLQPRFPYRVCSAFAQLRGLFSSTKCLIARVWLTQEWSEGGNQRSGPHVAESYSHHALHAIQVVFLAALKRGVGRPESPFWTKVLSGVVWCGLV